LIKQENMKCTIHFYKLNYDFSPEFAEVHHDGAPSANNRKYDWEDELAVKGGINDYAIQENAVYHLKGERNEEPFEEQVENMLLFTFEGKDGQQTRLAVSMKAVEDTEIQENDDRVIINVFLDAREPVANPVPGVYIALQDFPQSLI